MQCHLPPEMDWCLRSICFLMKAAISLSHPPRTIASAATSTAVWRSADRMSFTCHATEDGSG